jgi:hypothetical protein
VWPWQVTGLLELQVLQLSRVDVNKGMATELGDRERANDSCALTLQQFLA